MERGRAIYLGILAGIVSSILVGCVLVPRDDFNTRNSRWNGLSKLESDYDVEKTSDLKELSQTGIVPSNSALLLVGPSKAFSREEAEAVEEFLREGGKVVLADEFGTGNELLERLDRRARFTGRLLMDPLFMSKSMEMPQIPNIDNNLLNRGISTLAFNYATTIDNLGEKSEVLAFSSGVSFTVKAPESETPDEKGRPRHPVLARTGIGGGALILISDSSPFINTMIDRENNGELVEKLIEGRTVYLDTSHWEESRLVVFQEAMTRVHGVFGRSEMRYGLLILVAAVIFKFGWRGRNEVDREGVGGGEEIDQIMRRHPDWERSRLQDLKEEIDRDGFR